MQLLIDGLLLAVGIAIGPLLRNSLTFWGHKGAGLLPDLIASVEHRLPSTLRKGTEAVRELLEGELKRLEAEKNCPLTPAQRAWVVAQYDKTYSVLAAADVLKSTDSVEACPRCGYAD